MRRSY